MKKIICCLYLLMFNVCLSQNKNIILPIYIDSISNKLQFVELKNTHYTNLFSNKENIPLLVYHTLNPTKFKLLYDKTINNSLNKNQVFFEDKRINISIVKFYKNTGYDRGHLYNAEDSSFDLISFNSSYLITNATPQVIQFNRGIWKKLETSVRKQSQKNELFIITGCDLYEENNKKIGLITIPNYFFKVVINLTKNTTDIYYIPNKLCYDSFNNYKIDKKIFSLKTGIYLNLF